MSFSPTQNIFVLNKAMEFDRRLVEKWIVYMVDVQKSGLTNIVHEKMVLLFEEMNSKYIVDACDYYMARESYNEKHNIKSLAPKITAELVDVCEQAQVEAEFVDTSSVGAGTNLINDSDIDISMLVNNLDERLAEDIAHILDTVGFRFNGIANQNVEASRYYSFIRDVDKTEIEIKLRDKIKSKPIIDLHRLMILLKDSEKIMITWGKYMFKQISRSDWTKQKRWTDPYVLFKTLVYEMHFSGIEGNYMWQLDYLPAESDGSK